MFYSEEAKEKTLRSLRELRANQFIHEPTTPTDSMGLEIKRLAVKGAHATFTF